MIYVLLSHLVVITYYLACDEYDFFDKYCSTANENSLKNKNCLTSLLVTITKS